MISGMLQRRSILKGAIAVTPATGTTTSMVEPRMPALREAASFFDLGPLVREVHAEGWRRYGYELRRIPMTRFRRLSVTVLHEDQSAYPEEDDRDDMVVMRWEGPAGALQVSIRHVPDMLWSFMGRSERRDAIGALLASALRNAEAFLAGDAVVSAEDGIESIRMARINSRRRREQEAGREDPYPGIGPVTDFDANQIAWSIAATDVEIVIAPITASACPEPGDVVGMMRTVAGAERIKAAIGRAKGGGRC